MREQILRGYEASARGDFIERVEAISSADLLFPIKQYLPRSPSLVLDVGAGSGRDAAWFASQSHRVLAVEPVAALRDAGIERHGSPYITWLDDKLPELKRVLDLGQRYDLILVAAVWQHLDDSQREVAMSVFRDLIAYCGRIVISLRHGPGAPSRPVFPASASDTVKWARQNSLMKCAEVKASSVQAGNLAAGVTWTWLVFEPA